MKKLIFVLIMLMSVTAYAETSKYGSMWKQEDTTLIPADDIITVDFTGYSTIGVGGGGSPFDNITVTGVAVINQLTSGSGSTNTGTNSTIAGGLNNVVGGDYGFIGAGSGNNHNSINDVIVGGASNLMSFAGHSFIGGGEGNQGSGAHAVINGGRDNTIGNNGNYAVIGGGVSNYLSALYGVIPGGYGNTVYGDYGFMMGKYGRLDNTADRSSGFIYATSSTAVAAPDVHIIYGEAGYEKKVGIQTLAPESTLHIPDGFYAQFENYSGAAPAVGDCDADAERGRLFIDTGNNRFYICNGAARGWDYMALTD